MAITSDTTLWPICIASTSANTTTATTTIATAIDCPQPLIYPTMQYDWLPGTHSQTTIK